MYSPLLGFSLFVLLAGDLVNCAVDVISGLKALKPNPPAQLLTGHD